MSITPTWQEHEMARIAVVTGAGSGVGRAVVIDLAKRGFAIALVGRREEPLQETIALAQAHSRERKLAVSCDIANPDDVQHMADLVRAELGNPSVLVNSAGSNIAKRSLAEVSVEDYRQVIDINLNGAFYVTHAFLPGMRKGDGAPEGGGTIVHVISDAGLTANRISGVAYIASKFGLVGLTATINVEERNNGVRATAILPGEINTPLLDRRPVPPPMEARGKMLQPEDVAACVMLAIDLPDRAVVEQLLVRPRETR
jgi:NAD(P)-dependent dehydrogenase (short-subunit alcohol dehydrogenase family)